MTQEASAKLKSRIAEWRSCVGSENGVISQDPLTSGHAAPAQLSLVPSPQRQTEEPAVPHIEDLRRSVDHERERSRQLSETLIREQALHAATLMLQAERRQPPARPAPPPIPDRQELEAVMRHVAGRRCREQRARKFWMELAFIALAGGVAVAILFLVRLW